MTLVVIFAAGNDVIDMLSPDGTSAVESLADFLNTVSWPAVLFLLARRSPAQVRPAEGKDAELPAR